jgi:hypothetical protein
VADGAYAFTFALYDAAQDGNLLWSETQAGVAVKAGVFTVLLGSATPLPKQARISNGWLSVGVRGPGETDFTALVPRQLLNAATPAAPSSPAAGAACAHTHFGEEWTGDSTGAPENAGLTAQDTMTDGTAIEGVADTGSNAWGVYGESTYGKGVDGESTSGYGVFGHSTNNVGVRAETGSSSWPALQAVGLTGTSPAIEIRGSIHVDSAGVDSDTPVFIHKVVTGGSGNICSIQNYATVIDNPIINSKPDAILIVTPNFGPNNTGTAPAVGIPAVYYDATNQCGKGAGKWVIYNLNTVAQVNNSTFNVMAVLP